MIQRPTLAAAIGNAIGRAEDLRRFDDHPDEPATRHPRKRVELIHENSRIPPNTAALFLRAKVSKGDCQVVAGKDAR